MRRYTIRYGRRDYFRSDIFTVGAGPLKPLSDREREILQLIAKGVSNG